MLVTIDEAKKIATSYFTRRERFPDETEETSFLIVLLNYGDHLTQVHCINKEWSGIKGSVPVTNGIPVCPEGHPLIESPLTYRLELIQALR